MAASSKSVIMRRMAVPSDDTIDLDTSGTLYEGIEDVEAAGLFGNIDVSTVKCNKCEI